MVNYSGVITFFIAVGLICASYDGVEVLSIFKV